MISTCKLALQTSRTTDFLVSLKPLRVIHSFCSKHFTIIRKDGDTFETCCKFISGQTASTAIYRTFDCALKCMKNIRKYHHLGLPCCWYIFQHYLCPILLVDSFYPIFHQYILIDIYSSFYLCSKVR